MLTLLTAFVSSSHRCLALAVIAARIVLRSQIAYGLCHRCKLELEVDFVVPQRDLLLDIDGCGAQCLQVALRCLQSRHRFRCLSVRHRVDTGV